jgi:hypothetical protein
MFLQQPNIDWGASAPAGIALPDFFAGRLRFTLLVPAAGNHSFTVTADDQVSRFDDARRLDFDALDAC